MLEQKTIPSKTLKKINMEWLNLRAKKAANIKKLISTKNYCIEPNLVVKALLNFKNN